MHGRDVDQVLDSTLCIYLRHDERLRVDCAENRPVEQLSKAAAYAGGVELRFLKIRTRPQIVVVLSGYLSGAASHEGAENDYKLRNGSYAHGCYPRYFRNADP